MKYYIDFLNKAKNFKKDRVFFETYEDANNWMKENFEKINPDFIHIIQ